MACGVSRETTQDTLAHPRFFLKEVVSMRYRKLALTISVLVMPFVVGHAQTPDSAKKYFQEGLKNFARGNLELVFEDYSRAIELSSRLGSSKPAATDLLNTANPFDSAGPSDRITVIDPFTAIAYTNRGGVRFTQHD
ncbi:MAG: hypothetical protein DMF71_04085, partial [Acidobacteria bacterium]